MRCRKPDESHHFQAQIKTQILNFLLANVLKLELALSFGQYDWAMQKLLEDPDYSKKEKFFVFNQVLLDNKAEVVEKFLHNRNLHLSEFLSPEMLTNLYRNYSGNKNVAEKRSIREKLHDGNKGYEKFRSRVWTKFCVVFCGSALVFLASS